MRPRPNLAVRERDRGAARGVAEATQSGAGRDEEERDTPASWPGGVLIAIDRVGIADGATRTHFASGTVNRPLRKIVALDATRLKVG